ncbi:MAG: hypothetical protein FH748_12635 [Balneolaceae bacterium]|nr:hypothetical protein [Balneolaceae bacterium]
MKISFTPFLLFVTLGTLLLSCTNNDAQREFEEQAYQQPSNITQTNDSGTITSADNDDWREGPLFEGLIDIRPPFPNPVDVSSVINFEFEVTGVQSVNGLVLTIRYTDGSFGNVYFNQQTPLPPGISAFQINPAELGQFGTVESARGLHRVYLFDLNNRLISYGDIKVE